MANRRKGQQIEKAGTHQKPRMTVARKIEAIMRVIRGEHMELVEFRDDGSRCQSLARVVLRGANVL